MMTINLSEKERNDLQRARYTKTSNIGERAFFVILSDEGESVPEIAARTGHHEHTVRRWLKAYRDGGIEKLKNILPPGRPNIKGKIVEQRLDDILSKSPSDFGYPEEGWTSYILADYFAETGLKVSTDTVKRALKKNIGSGNVSPKPCPATSHPMRKNKKG